MYFHLIYEFLLCQCSVDSQTQFLGKCSFVLWKNPKFFISLPFKQNEDINPIRATHLGMTPVDSKLVIEECTQLESQGLIEPYKIRMGIPSFLCEYEI